MMSKEQLASYAFGVLTTEDNVESSHVILQGYELRFKSSTIYINKRFHGAGTAIQGAGNLVGLGESIAGNIQGVVIRCNVFAAYDLPYHEGMYIGTIHAAKSIDSYDPLPLKLIESANKLSEYVGGHPSFINFIVCYPL